jgi:hypothetical protein
MSFSLIASALQPLGYATGRATQAMLQASVTWGEMALRAQSRTDPAEARVGVQNATEAEVQRRVFARPLSGVGVQNATEAEIQRRLFSRPMSGVGVQSAAEARAFVVQQLMVEWPRGVGTMSRAEQAIYLRLATVYVMLPPPPRGAGSL